MRITGLPDSPQGIEWSPDGSRIAYLMTVPDDGPEAGIGAAQARGRRWAKPLEVIDKVTYRVDGGGYLKAGYDHIFMVDALGGSPRQLTFGAYHDGPPALVARRPVDPVQRGAQGRLGAGGERQRSLSRVSLAGRRTARR